jgi:hypothetical protein
LANCPAILPTCAPSVRTDVRSKSDFFSPLSNRDVDGDGNGRYLDDRHLGAEHEDGGHLEDDAEGVTDVVAVELLEALGAVAALEEEGAAHGGVGEALLQVARLPGEHDRREGLDRLEHDLQLRRVRVLRQLQRLLRRPAVHRPLRRRLRGRGRGRNGAHLLLGRHRRRRGLRGRRDAVALRRLRGVHGANGAAAPEREERRRVWTGLLRRGRAGHGGGGGGVGGERHCEQNAGG